MSVEVVNAGLAVIFHHEQGRVLAVLRVRDTVDDPAHGQVPLGEPKSTLGCSGQLLRWSRMAWATAAGASSVGMCLPLTSTRSDPGISLM